MFRTNSHQKFKKKFQKVREDAEEYELLSEYIASNTTITVKHKECGEVFKTHPVKLTRTRSPVNCPRCKGNKITKKSTEQIKDEIYRYGNGQFTLLHDDTTKGSHYLHIQHECGYVFKVYRNNILIWGLTCPICRLKSVKSPAPQMRQIRTYARIQALSKGRYELISSYINYSSPVRILDKETGEEEEVIYSALMKRIKQMFPDKIDKDAENKLIQEMVSEFVLKCSNGRYELKSEFKGYKERVDVYDRTYNRVDRITGSALKARLMKIDNRTKYYQKSYIENGHSDDLA